MVAVFVFIVTAALVIALTLSLPQATETEFLLTILTMLKFSENHAHVTIDHCIVVCAVIAVFTLCYAMTSMINILVE